jgi:signal transduction histidine kinase
MLEALVERAEMLESLIADLLDVERMERRAEGVRLRTTDIKVLVARVAECVDLRGRALELDLDPAIIELDVPKVERMLEELIINGVRHTPDGTTLRLSSTRMGDGVLLAIEDNGRGVMPQDRQRIFEPLAHGSEGIGHDPGSGVGLAYVTGVAEMHGGTAWVEDSVMGGARFCVMLPGRPAGAGTLETSGTSAA